jgi:hypothetical protein
MLDSKVPQEVAAVLPEFEVKLFEQVLHPRAPEGSPHREAVRMMVRLMGLPTRETNSSHASSSEVPAHRQTMSFREETNIASVWRCST